MSMGGGLPGGSRVAVVGGGVAGAAMAASLLYNARARARSLHVTVYDGGGEARTPPPVVLTAECRSRLAALGCRLPHDWRGLELRALEVISQGRRDVQPAPSGGLWLMDAWPHGEAGMTALRNVVRQ